MEIGELTYLALKTWPDYEGQDEAYLYYAGYRCIPANRSSIVASRGIAAPIGDALILVHRGTLPCVGGGEALCKIVTSEDGHVVITAPEGNSLGQSAFDTWVVLLIRGVALQDGRGPAEEDYIEKRSYYASLLASVVGLNLVYSLEIEQFLYPNRFSLSRRYPAGLMRPELSWSPLYSVETVDRIKDLHSRIGSRAPQEIARIRLALRWLDRGIRSVEFDALIFLWMAFEALLLHGGTNIRPICECLGRAYGISSNRANEKFGIGKLHGLRSKLFHGKSDAPPSARLNEYLQTLFTDALFEAVGMQCRREALAFVRNKDFDLKDFR